MTTIAFKDGVMASDSCWTSRGDVQYTSLSKIRRLSSGALLGQAGTNDCREMDSLLDKIKQPSKLPTRDVIANLKLDFIGLLAFPRGKLFMVSSRENPSDYNDEIGIWECNRGFATCGSGGDIALGALAAGKSAREAVAIACKFDINSRLPVHVVSLAASK